MAYNLQTMARNSQKDINLHEDNRNPRGTWSDGATIWVADAARAKLFGYPLQGSAPTREFGLHGNNANPWGIWSDGSVIWVVDRSETKLFAYDLSTQSRNPGRDIELSSGNSSPAGAWSDGLNIWVADDAGSKLYAYRTTDGQTDGGKDFSTLQAAGNTTPAGLWSDGRTIWVSDTGTSKVYAYNLPISRNANLHSITIDEESIQNPSSETENRHYIKTRPERVTVSAAPQHPRATVVILPADADNAQEGHQFQMGNNSHDFTITVTAQDGSTAKTYRVKVITLAGKPTIEKVTPGKDSLEIVWKHPDDTGGVETNQIYYYNLRHIRSDATDRSDGEWTFAYLVWFVEPAAPLRYTIEGLDNGVSYDLQVQAWTRAGNSSWSETATGTPSATNSPAFDEGTTAGRSIAENAPTNTPIGKPITATDADQEDTLAYSLAGSDRDHFSIDSSSGQIRVSSDLDFETRQQYILQVQVTDGLNVAGETDNTVDATITVTIDVENLDEPGSLDLPDTAKPPRDTVPITVPTPTDEDGDVTEVTWQWSKSSFSLTGFVNIRQGTSASYTPTSGDIDHYLRVRANYTDPQGPGKTVSATTSSTVGESPNQAPAFTGTLVQREVDENTPANTPIGEPITATDPDEGDDLTYSLTGTDASRFSIDRSSGQLRTKLDLDYETKQQYTLQVQVTDGTADATITVTITVTNAEEPGTITVLPSTPAVHVALTATLIDPDGSITNTAWQWRQRDTLQGSSWQNISGETSASYTPTQTGRYLQVTAKYDDGHGTGKSAVRETAVSVTNTPPSFSTNPSSIDIQENNTEGAQVGTPINASDANGDPLTYGLRDTNASSRHAASFSIDDNGQIKVAPGVRLDHEPQPTYRVTVEVTDGRDSSGNADSVVDDSLELTINVTDANDPGVVTFGNPYPQNGLAITASLADQDGLIASSETWQWAQSDNAEGPWNNISGATQFSYTPLPADLDKYLQATVTYTDSTYGGNQTASALTDNPVDEPIQLTLDNYELEVFENTLEGWPLLGDLPRVNNSNDQVTYSISGNDSGKYSIDELDGEIRVKKTDNLDHETNPQDTLTLRVEDKSGASDTAQVTINIKNLMEDDETKILTIPGHGTITWTRIAETQFLMARNQSGVRKPEFELNAQLDPCFREGQPGDEQLLIRTDYEKYDQYQLDMWWDGDTLKYRDPRRSQEWTGYNITQPDITYARGTNETCPAVYLDLWNDPDTLYALDTSHRLIKAYDLLAAGTQYERDHARDIPLSQDHYRSHHEIQGIWGDEDHIWVNRAAQAAVYEDLHIAAYSRSTFLRQTDADFDLSTEAIRPFRTILDAHLLEGVLWTIDLSDREAIYGRNPGNLADVNTCSDSSVTNKTQSALPKQYLRVTRQGNLLYALNYGSQSIDTYDVSSCPPTETESEFDYQEIEHLPGHGLQAVPTGISTDDGLLMYFSFPTGEIRHIGKILPTVVEDSHTITIRENTDDGVHGSRRQPAGLPFRVRSEQKIGQYNWHLEDPNDEEKSTGCGDMPASDDKSDASHFDCSYSGSRQQSLQILTRKEKWFDHEEQSSYTFTLRVKDVDDDTDSVTLTIELKDVDETPARPGRPELSNIGQQSIRVNWSKVTKLVGQATPRTDLDLITGYIVEYTPRRRNHPAGPPERRRHNHPGPDGPHPQHPLHRPGESRQRTRPRETLPLRGDQDPPQPQADPG